MTADLIRALAEVLEFQSSPAGPTIHDFGRWRRAHDTAKAAQSPAEGDGSSGWTRGGDLPAVRDAAKAASGALSYYLEMTADQPQPKGTGRDDAALTQALEERDAASDYIDALLDEVLGKDRHEWTSSYGHADAMDEVRERMHSLESSLSFHKRRCDALQACQSTMRDPERTMVCDILANGSLLINGQGKLAAERYAIQAPAPGDQPQEVQNAAWRKWADAGTVASLIGYLATLDQAAPIVTAYHVTLGDGERRCKTRSLTISRERVDHATKTIRSADTSLPYTHVLWAQPPEEAQAPAVGAEPVARVTVTDAGWAQLRVFDTVVRGEYGSNGFDLLAALASEVNSDAMGNAQPPVQPMGDANV